MSKLGAKKGSTFMYLTENELTFLYDLLIPDASYERSFLEQLKKDPNDKSARALYADWLDERGRSKSAEMVRGGYTPRPAVIPPVYSTNVVSGNIASGFRASGIT